MDGIEFFLFDFETEQYYEQGTITNIIFVLPHSRREYYELS